jgi:hypothetical protein
MFLRTSGGLAGHKKRERERETLERWCDKTGLDHRFDPLALKEAARVSDVTLA